VVCALVLSLAYPLKEYLGQRGDIASLEQQTRAAQQRVSALQERRRQLSHPAYIKAQARKRLQYVLPGESVYVVVTPAPAESPVPAVAPVQTAGRDGSWYERLWGTVRAADDATSR
jgi:Septum formation initiator